MTRYEAFIEKSWRTSGITQLIVARIRADGSADIGFFLVDFWCLGVKDAFLEEDASESFLREFLTERLPEEFSERVHPACAKKMIAGAIAYAERLGFAPPRDYRKARRALSGLDATACSETFTFGRDGKPFYVKGPDDTPERVERVLALLEARCGPDGFGYELADEGDDDYSRENLREFFDHHGPDSLDFYAFAGLVAALHICPVPVTPLQLIERLVAEDRELWSGEEELRDFTQDLAAYWNEIADLIAASVAPTDDPARPDPIDIYAADFGDSDGPAPVEDLATAFIAWSDGFIRATRDWPEAWGDTLTRPELTPHWQLLRAWAEPGKPEHAAFLSGTGPDIPAGATLPAAVTALARALRPSGPPPVT